MRNLKKVLSLTVVLAMAFTLMAGAFTDSESIKNTSAVDIVSALGVIKGYTDGSYQPEKVVTRAEMAKMIYVVKNGGKDDGATYYTGVATGLTDVKGHWAEGYINYCYALGIIAGKGEGIFAPNDAVTGLEAAKMLLVVIGYNADKAGLVGSAWALKTAAIASEAGLFDDYSVAMDAGCPRDFAALMIYNAIEANTVRWSDDLGDYDDHSAIGVEYDTVGEAYMGLKEYIGIFEGVEDYTIGATAGEGEIAVGGRVATFGGDISMIAEEVKVLYKDSTSGTAGVLDTKDTVFGVVKTGETNVYTGTRDDVKAIEDNKDTAKLRVGSSEYKINTATGTAAGVTVIKNYNTSTLLVDSYEDTDSNPATPDVLVTIVEKLRSALRAKSTDELKFVTNTDGEIATVFVTEKYYSMVGSLSSSKIQLQGEASIDLEDAVLYDGIAVDDIVCYTKLFGDKYYIYPATVVEGEVDATRSSTEVRIDGTFYAKYDNRSSGKPSTSNITDSDYSVSSLVAGDSYQLVMDGKYWVAAKTIDTSSKNYAVVIGATKGSTGDGITDNGKAKLLLSDGSKVTLDIHKDSSAGLLYPSTATTSPVGQVVAYDLKDSGTSVKLTAVTKQAGTHSFNESTKVLSVAGSGKILASNAVAFIKTDSSDSDSWKVFDANGIDSLVSTSADMYYKTNTDGKVEVFGFDYNHNVKGASDTSIYGYITATPYTYEVDDEDFTDVTLWTADGEITVTFEGDMTDGTGSLPKLVKEDFIKIPNSSIAIEWDTDCTQITAASDYDTTSTTADEEGASRVADYESARGLLTLTSAATSGTEAIVKITSDTQIVYIDSFNVKGQDGGSIMKYSQVSGEQWKNVVVFAEYDSGDAVTEVSAIFVDVDNKLCKGKIGQL